MSGRSKQAWLILALLAMVSFLSWPIYKKISRKSVSIALRDRTQAVVEKNPSLQPDWDRAMDDGVLTWDEARAILEKAGEKAEPES
jgi:hypothetical protein